MGFLCKFSLFFFHIDQLVKSYKSKSISKREIGYQTYGNRREPSAEQLEFEQKIEALTNQFNENYKNLQKQRNQKQMQVAYSKYLQDYSKFLIFKWFHEIFPNS